MNSTFSKILTTALLLVFATTASKAFASQPGESSSYTLVNVGGVLATRNDRAEARNGRNLLEVWRGADNNRVWMSLNNGMPFTTRTLTATMVAPIFTHSA